MENFPDGVFYPEVIEVMTAALEESVGTLPEPVSTAHVRLLAESILRTAKAGERDVAVLRRIALVTTFRSSCSLAAPTIHELRKVMVTSKVIIPAPFSI